MYHGACVFGWCGIYPLDDELKIHHLFSMRSCHIMRSTYLRIHSISSRQNVVFEVIHTRKRSLLKCDSLMFSRHVGLQPLDGNGSSASATVNRVSIFPNLIPSSAQIVYFLMFFHFFYFLKYIHPFSQMKEIDSLFTVANKKDSFLLLI